MKTNIPEVIQKIKKLQEAYQTSAQELISPAMKSLVHGQIAGYQFTAYTPYFNDGEECSFSVNEPQIMLTKDPAKIEEGEEVKIAALNSTAEIEEVNGDLVKVRLKNGNLLTLPLSEVTLSATDEDCFEESSYSLSGALKVQAKLIEDLVSNIPEEIVKSAYGEHVRITVYADRVVVEEYTDHE